MSFRTACFVFLLCVGPLPAADPMKIVIIVGANYYKPGEHDYLAAGKVLTSLLKQSEGVDPVVSVEWPKDADTFAGAKAVVLFFDGGDKHGLLKGDRFKTVQTLSAQGVGLVQLHQVIDYPNDFGDRVKLLTGGVWQKGHSLRAHWVSEFAGFPDHPIFRGVKPFKIDDGWLTKLKLADTGVTPLLKTVSPKTTPAGANDVVAWAYQPTTGGRAFNFTGGHLHASFAEEGYRRFLINGILWAGGREVPAGGAPVDLDPDRLSDALTPTPMKK